MMEHKQDKYAYTKIKAFFLTFTAKKSAGAELDGTNSGRRHTAADFFSLRRSVRSAYTQHPKSLYCNADHDPGSATASRSGSKK